MVITRILRFHLILLKTEILKLDKEVIVGKKIQKRKKDLILLLLFNLKTKKFQLKKFDLQKFLWTNQLLIAPRLLGLSLTKKQMVYFLAKWKKREEKLQV